MLAIRPVVVFVAVVLVSLFSASAANSQISWTPANLSHNALIGTSPSTQTSFVSSVALNNVQLRVVPELAPFVSVSPLSFTSIPAGVPQNVSITFNIPNGTQAQLRDGAIHLIAGLGNGKTYARPLPVSLNIKEATSFEIPVGVALPSGDRIITEQGLEGNLFVKDEIDIFFKEDTSQNDIINLVSQINGKILGSIADENFYQVQVNQEGFINLSNIINQLMQNPNVELAIPNLLNNIESVSSNSQNLLSSYDPASLINLPSAWGITTGSRNIKIGVLDSVFASEHLDLKNNITPERPILNTIPLTSSSHGTMVAGIIGALGNNNIGINGTMWNTSLHLFSTAVIDPNTKDLGSSLPLVALGLKEAIKDDSVRIINYSAAIECPGHSDECMQSLFYNDRFWKRHIEKNPNVLFVFAAGNEGIPLGYSSPARLSGVFDNVISVSAVDGNKELADFSNYGPNVIAAPGTNITSLAPCIINLLDPICTRVSTGSGTSFAAPSITGVAGLMLSKNSSLTAAQIKSIIRCTAKDTNNLDPFGDHVFLLDAYGAVQAASSGNACNTGTGTVRVEMTLNGSLTAHGGVTFDLVGPNGVINGSGIPSQRLNLPTGQYTLIYKSGGPVNSTLTGITPSATQTLTAGGTINFTLNFSTQNFQWLSLIGGNPYIPGDGIFANNNTGFFSSVFELNPTSSLAGTTDSITLTVFTAANAPQPQEAGLYMRKAGDTAFQCGFLSIGLSYPQQVTFNGVQGTVFHLPEENLALMTELFSMICGSNIEIIGFAIIDQNGNFINSVDAAALGRRSNGYPGTLVP